MWKRGKINLQTKTTLKTELEGTGIVLEFQRDSPLVAPPGSHTALLSQNLLTPELRSKVNLEFRGLTNLGNT